MIDTAPIPSAATAALHSSEPATNSGPVDEQECLRTAAKCSQGWDVVYHPATQSKFPSRVFRVRGALERLEHGLDRSNSKSVAELDASASSVLAKVLASSRLLRSAYLGVADSGRLVRRLPRLAESPSSTVAPQSDVPRVVALAECYLAAMESEFSADTFRAYIEELQTRDALLVEELWFVPASLSFSLLETLLLDVEGLMRSPSQAVEQHIETCLQSMKSIGFTDWIPFTEPLIAFDATLRKDPAGAYAAMDFDSRETYRKRVSYAARYSDSTETVIAQEALGLAEKARETPVPVARIQQRRMHVGYYLVGEGFAELAGLIGFHAPMLYRIRGFVTRHADDFYITGIQCVTVVLIALAVLPLVPRNDFFECLIVALLLLLPVSQAAVDLVNNAITALFDPAPLPKLDFTQGIPADRTTLVTVPTLLLSEAQVKELVHELELRFLVNRDPNIHFALLTDLPDSVSKPREHDSDPLVDLAVKLITELNGKYSGSGAGSFLLLHRHRVFNKRQGVWMGWERKRGKLLDVNKLLTSGYDAFPIKAGNLDVLSKVKYILTLDSDTQLPYGAASRLVGALAHPLNQAVIDPTLRIVTSGYGILQPRVGITVRSASKSRLAVIFSGQTGFDVYARAISDAYQDLYGEGSFTGKGIYEVETLHQVLDHRFPRNALLSHDLIEGAYARAGLATDVEVIDDYPSHYSAFARRKHRWVRGDWQVIQWIFARVPEESGRRVANPISAISRWKIFDNLRRSLVEPAMFVLFVAGWLGLPGGALYWTCVLLALLIFPALVQFSFGVMKEAAGEAESSLGDSLAGLGQSMLIVLFNAVFLAHQTLLSLDAIVRALIRRFITGERLLEWETAAQAESRSQRRTAVDRYLALTPLLALALGVLVFVAHPHSSAVLFAVPMLLLWSMASICTAWLNASPGEESKRLRSADEAYLRSHAMRIWRYFYQFSSPRHHYLIPDNVEEKGMFEAARVSPTNVGFLLNARQAAWEFGFITAPEFALLTAQTLDTIDRLEKYRGCLINWYNTETLQPVWTREVSSVDSGNFTASLYMLHAGAAEMLERPLIGPQLLRGLRIDWDFLHDRMGAAVASLHLSPPPDVASDATETDWSSWLQWLRATSVALGSLPTPAPVPEEEDSWCIGETRRRIDAILTLIEHYAPWMLPEYHSLRDVLELRSLLNAGSLKLSSMADLLASMDIGAADAGSASLSDAVCNVLELTSQLKAIAERADKMAAATESGFLVHPGRRLLSIGYDVDKQKLHDACYDMLASETRVATFLAVARNDLPQQSWFKLSREHTLAAGRFVLLSWTGTTFEYLMPALWMRSYPGTLISRTLDGCVHAHRAYAASRGIPWGISESGFAQIDDAGHYGYHAFGVPDIALKPDADAGPVISPYSTFLCLSIDPAEAIRNVYRMDRAGWGGAYGLYEAADYRECTKSSEAPSLVREWMAHHQGMSLLALLNLLHDNIAQKWFHSNPLLEANEILLHEVPPRKSELRRLLQRSGPYRRPASQQPSGKV